MEERAPPTVAQTDAGEGSAATSAGASSSWRLAAGTVDWELLQSLWQEDHPPVPHFITPPSPLLASLSASPLPYPCPSSAGGALEEITKRDRAAAKAKKYSPHVLAIRQMGGVYLQLRGDCRYYMNQVLPKIPKSDMRRGLPQMFCNAINSGDPDLMAGFLRAYASQDVIHRRIGRHASSGVAAVTVKRVTMQGSDMTLELWRRQAEAMPDRAYRAHSGQVTARSDGTGLVECLIDMQATILVDGAAASARREWEWVHKEQYASIEEQADQVLPVDLPRDELRVQVMGSVKLIHKTATARLRLHLDSTSSIREIELEQVGIHTY